MAMQYATGIVCIAALLASFSPRAVAQTDSAWDIVVNGRAVHINAGEEWNEDNWGLGLERELGSKGPWVKVALANAFKDSMGEPSYMAGGGIKRRFRMRSDGFYVDVGAVAFLMTRDGVNGDKPFPGVLPAATFGFKRVALNLTYMPESIVDRVTNSNFHDPSMEGVFFLQLKLDGSLFGLGRRSGPWLAQRD
jgi:hypothetical protein